MQLIGCGCPTLSTPFLLKKRQWLWCLFLFFTSAFSSTAWGQADIKHWAGAFFEANDFNQKSQAVNEGSFNLDSNSIANDSLSSLRVAPGFKITLYEHYNLQGASRIFTSDASSLGDFNDKTSSYKVEVISNNIPSTFNIISKNILGTDNKSMCIDISAGGTANGTNIQLWTCSPLNINQAFTYNPTDLHLRSKANPNKCVDVKGAGIANGTNIQLWDCLDVLNQKFNYVNNLFRPMHVANKCIDISAGGRTDGTNIQLWDCQAENINQPFELSEWGSTRTVALNYNVTLGHDFAGKFKLHWSQRPGTGLSRDWVGLYKYPNSREYWSWTNTNSSGSVNTSSQVTQTTNEGWIAKFFSNDQEVARSKPFQPQAHVWLTNDNGKVRINWDSVLPGINDYVALYYSNGLYVQDQWQWVYYQNTGGYTTATNYDESQGYFANYVARNSSFNYVEIARSNAMKCCQTHIFSAGTGYSATIDLAYADVFVESTKECNGGFHNALGSVIKNSTLPQGQWSNSKSWKDSLNRPGQPLLLVNANFFAVKKVGEESLQPYRDLCTNAMGLSVNNHELTSLPGSVHGTNTSSLIFFHKGYAEATQGGFAKITSNPTLSQYNLDQIQYAVSGYRLLVGGYYEVQQPEAITPNLPRPRTAMGLSVDGKRLYILTVNSGSDSKGATLREMSDTIRGLGAYQALTMDGSGSAQFQYTNAAGRETKTAPSDTLEGLNGYYYRPVPVVLGVRN